MKIIRNVDDEWALVFTRTTEGELDRGLLARHADLQQTAAWQPMAESKLVEPYDFLMEIVNRLPSIQQIQRHLYRQGILKQEDLDDPQKRQVFESVFPRIS